MNWLQLQAHVATLLVHYGARIAGVLVLLFLAWIAAGWAKSALERTMSRARLDATLTRFLGALTRWMILILAALSSLGVFGVETTSFAALLGAAGLAIGLACQGALSNLAAGLMLLMFRPFKVGDVVTTAGQTGKIDAIELFTTSIDTFDNRRVIMPNGSIFGSVIENITHHSIRRAEVKVGVSYSANIDHTREVLMQAAREVPAALADPAPFVVLLDLGASSVNWSVFVWAKAPAYGDVRQATLRAVKQALDAAGIDIPYPKLDVHLSHPVAAP